MTPEENKQLILAELDRLYPRPKPELHFTNPYETLVAVSSAPTSRSTRSRPPCSRVSPT